MLTTRCPHCGTAFRIRPEQLSVRGGRVRCGHCQQPFSALAQLEDVDDEDLGAINLPPRPAATPQRPAPQPPQAAARSPILPPNPVPPVSPSAQRSPVGAGSSGMARPGPASPPPTAPRTPAPQPPAAAQDRGAAASAPQISPALFNATGLPPVRHPATPAARPATPAATPGPRSQPAAAPSAWPDIQSSRSGSNDPRKTRPANLSSMPVPNAMASDEASTATSWDSFKIPGDVGTPADHEEPSFSAITAPDFLDGPMDRNRSPLARTIKDAPKPTPPREVHKEPSFGPVTKPAAPEPEEEEFSMSIVLDGDSVPNNTPDDPDFDKPAADASPARTEPYQSEIARQLGIPAYAPADEHSTVDQTVMLEEPVEIVATTLGNGPESLFDEHERQQRHKDGKGKGVEDRRKKRSGGYLWVLGSILMLAVFALLASYLMRMELARAVPTLRPTLENACSWIGCTVPYPQDADQIVLQGHSFNPENSQEQDGKYRLIVTLTNKAGYAQSWPNIELTVTDRFDIAVARRVLKPSEWLPAANAKQPAFEAHSEITANLPITLDNVQAAGYRLYVFYP